MRNFEETDLSIVENAVPAKCNDCPVQCELKSALLAAMIIKHLTESLGENLVGDAGEKFDVLVDNLFPEEETHDVKASIRKSVGKSIEEVSADVDAAQREIDANALSCCGVLKMRASKNDIEYTVSLCTSPREYLLNSDSPLHAPAHIRARTQSES